MAVFRTSCLSYLDFLDSPINPELFRNWIKTAKIDSGSFGDNYDFDGIKMKHLFGHRFVIDI